MPLACKPHTTEFTYHFIPGPPIPPATTAPSTPQAIVGHLPALSVPWATPELLARTSIPIQT